MERDHIDFLFFAGKCALKLKKDIQTISYFKKCLALDDNHFGASVFLANTLLELNQFKTAAKYYSNAIRIDTNKTSAHIGLILAVTRHTFGSEVAITYLKKIIKEDPDNFIVLT